MQMTHLRGGVVFARLPVTCVMMLFLCLPAVAGTSGEALSEKGAIPAATTTRPVEGQFPFYPSASRPSSQLRHDGVVVRPPYFHTTRPLTLEEAVKWEPQLKCAKGAADVQFAVYHEWLTWQDWISFRAPPEVCKAAAVELLKGWNARNPGDAVSVELGPIDEAARKAFLERKRKGTPVALVCEPFREESAAMPIGWFVPEQISHGVEGGGGRVPSVRVWVDLDRNVVFYQEGEGGDLRTAGFKPPGIGREGLPEGDTGRRRDAAP